MLVDLQISHLEFMRYSTASEREAYLRFSFDNTIHLSEAPITILDLDGNVLVGYKALDAARLPGGSFRDPLRQTIPNGADVEALVASGVVEPRIFAEKNLDVRLPPALVTALNRRLEAGDYFSLCFLTSRPFDDARFILEQSGVHHLDKLTLVAAAGNSVQALGERKDTRVLTDDEKRYVGGASALAEATDAKLRRMLEAHGRSVAGLPPLMIEVKDIGFNLHYRELITALGVKEDSALGQDIARIVEHAVEGFIAGGPREPDSGRPVFMLVPGKATAELTVPTANKAVGVQAIMRAAQRAGRRPRHVTFAGDDCFNWKDDLDTGEKVVDEKKGTDYPAMAYVKNGLTHDFAARGEVIYTHHPLRESLAPAANAEEEALSRTPNPYKAIPAGDPLHPSDLHGVGVITASPVETGALVVESMARLDAALARNAKPEVSGIRDAALDRPRPRERGI